MKSISRESTSIQAPVALTARGYDRVRIMMVTTETESEQVTRALNAGANEYVMKPFTKDVLVAKLNMLDVFEE